MNRRGRPPKLEGALTPAQRKAAQRERDRAAVLAADVSMEDLTTTALLESLPNLVAEQQAGMLGAVLKEIGKRGGVTVSAQPAAKTRGK